MAGFCHIDRKFKDFILSRCLNARKLDAPGATPEADRFWHERFAVALTPNPALSRLRQLLKDQPLVHPEEAFTIDRALPHGHVALILHLLRRLDLPALLDRKRSRPALSESQRAVVAQDYEMKGGLAEVPVRKALLYYFQKRMRIDVDVGRQLDNPHEIPVVVANRADFDAALAEAMA